MMRSNNLVDTTGRHLLADSFFLSKGLSFLKIGVISANFSSSGNEPSVSVLLNKFCKIVTVDSEQFFKIFVGMPLHPFPFFESSPLFL